LKWEMRQNSLFPKQEKFVTNMVDFLIINPDATIDVYPIQYAEKEKEYILFFEAKKKYFLLNKNNQSLSEDDSLKIEKLSIKDSSFVNYLNKQFNNTLIFTIQEKCLKFIGSEIIDTKFEQLTKERENTFMNYFKKVDLEKRVKFYPQENIVPYNGFSFYKIVYKGELPESLIKAHELMNDLNNEAPRKKFERKREKNKNKI